MPRSTARFGSDAYATHIGARLREFFADTTPWQRRCWDAGTVLSLREVHDATDWAGLNVLSGGTLRWLARDVERVVGTDRGTGDQDLRRELQKILRGPLSPGARAHRQLRQITDMVEAEYLVRWSAALDSARAPAPERLARAVATHLLDLGYTMGYLHRWISRLITTGASLAEMLAAASELAGRERTEYEVLVPFVAVPRSADLAAHLETWLDGPATSTWLKERAGAPKGVRHNGGFRFKITALEPYGAAGAASLIVERMIARTSYARALGGGLQPLGRVWVADHDVGVALHAPQRGAHVLSLVAERRLYAAEVRTALDDALELAAPLNHGAPGPAVSGGWAAIEALLVCPADTEDAKEGRGAVAADRLAALVACSWPRSELTALAHRHLVSVGDRLHANLKAATTNRERSLLVADGLLSGGQLNVIEPEDAAAQSRMERLIAEPRATLLDVQSHVTRAFRRLYRQRNIVVHGGSTGALALDVTLRTAAPLVGAGLDRIVHAQLAEGVAPLDLAERARLNLRLVGGRDGPHIADLLESRPRP